MFTNKSRNNISRTLRSINKIFININIEFLIYLLIDILLKISLIRTIVAIVFFLFLQFWLATETGYIYYNVCG